MMADYPSNSYSYTFLLVVINPCLTAVVSSDNNSLTLMNYYIGDPQATTILPSFSSSVSNLLCGSFNYSVYNSDWSPDRLLSN